MLSVCRIHRWEYLFGPEQGCDTFWQASHLNVNQPTDIRAAPPTANSITGRQLNLLTNIMIFLYFISCHCVQTHAIFAFLWIGTNAHQCCAVRQSEALLFQQATAHSMRVARGHMAAPWKYSVSQHGSQAKVLQTSVSSTTVNKLRMPTQKYPHNIQQCFKHTYRNT